MEVYRIPGPLWEASSIDDHRRTVTFYCIYGGDTKGIDRSRVERIRFQNQKQEKTIREPLKV